jgi:hypothetical protein
MNIPGWLQWAEKGGARLREGRRLRWALAAAE